MTLDYVELCVVTLDYVELCVVTLDYVEAEVNSNLLPSSRRRDFK